MEKITGMKIARQRQGTKMQEPPRRLSFFNDKGTIVLDIYIHPHSGEVLILPFGAHVLIDSTKANPLFKQQSGAEGLLVTTCKNYSYAPVFTHPEKLKLEDEE